MFVACCPLERFRFLIAFYDYETSVARTKRPARSASTPIIAAVVIPTNGPTNAIISLGEFGSGIEAIIAAS